jgi:thymidylate synthase (FAD)
MTPEAKKLLNVDHPVLDHGSVTLLDVMGDDEAIEAAARVSFTGGESEERTEVQRRGLIRYLMRHQHNTPIEMVVFKFRVVAPIFVARQWIRHRMSSTNEISGRYAVLPDLYYTPEPEHVALQSTSNKQGRSTEPMAHPKEWSEAFRIEQQGTRATYEHRVNNGMAKELARINLPVSQYTAWVWKIDLHNLFHFLELRMDSHAQYEIRSYADVIARIVHDAVPIAWEAFCDFRLDARTFSRQELTLLASALDPDACKRLLSDLPAMPTRREADDFLTKLVTLMECRRPG